MKNKLVLGTVQFGCQYGINSEGRPDEQSVANVLRLAARNGIGTLDTSAAYGDAEKVLGRIMPNMGSLFQIVSKYPECPEAVADTFEKTLQTLGVTQIYGYLLHHFGVYRNNPGIWEEFRKLKAEGRIQKIGFSLYSPLELELLLQDDVWFDLLQFPYNIFDRQFEPYLGLLKEKGVEVHVRSTFLQGLFFMDRNHLPEKLMPLKSYLEELDSYAAMQDMTVAEVALNYNLQHPCIDGVLVGVDNMEQLLDNIRSMSDKKVELNIDVKEKELLNPVNW